jgi:hypothetical protein
MTVSKRGLVKWTPVTTAEDSLVIRLYDQKEYSAVYQWPLVALDCKVLSPGVRFRTSESDFPGVLQAEKDSIVLQLQTVSGTGVKPFTYQARFFSGGDSVLNDTAGLLRWKPVLADTGSRVLLVTVKDKYSRSDTLTPALSVVPMNRYPCTLSYVYSGTTLSPGVVAINYPGDTETLTFTIHDRDHPLTERYIVDIVKDRVRSSQSLSGDGRTFTITIQPSRTIIVDTIRVMVQDMTGSRDTARIVVRYNAFRLDEIPNLTVLLTAEGGVSVLADSVVTQWEDTSSTRNQVFTSSGFNSRPGYVRDAVNGHGAINFVRNMMNDNLVNQGIGAWANAPFTLFVVFKLNTVDNGRQTLVSTGGNGTVDFGITCNGTLGIFNETFGNNCQPSSTANSNLSIQANRWYVATFSSSSGVGFSDIQVQAALNGTTASSTLVINYTDAGMYMLLGAGNYGNYTGGLSGMIATVVYYRRALTATELQQVEEYLMSEYGIGQ